MEQIKRIWLKIWNNTIGKNIVLAVGFVLGLWLVSSVGLSIFTRHYQRKAVPDFIGVHIDEVEKMARKADMRLEVIDSIYAPIYGGGVVIEQQPLAGTEVKKGRRVFVTITSHQQKLVPVPYVTGFSLRQAKNMIEMAGLEIKELRYVPSMATNNVLAQIAGRDTVRRGSNLQLEVGTGLTLIVGRSATAAAATVPKITGLSIGEAKSRIWERGLNIGEITRDAGINLVNQRDARVYQQSPVANRSAALGSKVSFSLTLDQEKVPK